MPMLACNLWVVVERVLGVYVALLVSSPCVVCSCTMHPGTCFVDMWGLLVSLWNSCHAACPVCNVCHHVGLLQDLYTSCCGCHYSRWRCLLKKKATLGCCLALTLFLCIDAQSVYHHNKLRDFHSTCSKFCKSDGWLSWETCTNWNLTMSTGFRTGNSE